LPGAYIVARWQVETWFFNWIKQHLANQGILWTPTPGSRVKIPAGVAGLGLRARAIIRKRLDLDASLYQILQILSVTPFRENAPFTGVQEGLSRTDLPENTKGS